RWHVEGGAGPVKGVLVETGAEVGLAGELAREGGGIAADPVPGVPAVAAQDGSGRSGVIDPVDGIAQRDGVRAGHRRRRVRAGDGMRSVGGDDSTVIIRSRRSAKVAEFVRITEQPA